MKNTTKKSLSLKTQTLRSLQQQELQTLGGGFTLNRTYCLPCSGSGHSVCLVCYQ